MVKKIGEEKQMKKSLIFLYLIATLLMSCSNKGEKKENELKKIQNSTSVVSTEKDIEGKIRELSILKEENNHKDLIIEELKEKIEELEKKNMGLVLRLVDAAKNNVNIFDSSKYRTHDMDLLLDFRNKGVSACMYLRPENEDEIYVIDNEVFHVSNIVHVKATKETYVKGRTEKGVEGFVEISGDPYTDGKYEPAGSIEFNGQRINLLRIINESFVVDEGAILRIFPSESADEVYVASHDDGNKVIKVTESMITSDYKWMKISIDDNTGWVQVDKLSKNRGGIGFNFPEDFVEWDLIWSHLI
ncbi:MAG: hypothetical protein J6Y16_06075 [Treponema sp.]|nr:hypothetical protein [Treponema sp.]